MSVSGGPALCYMLRNSAWAPVDLTGWSVKGTAPGSFTSFNPGIDIIYQKVFVPGVYTLDSFSAMYACNTTAVGGGSPGGSPGSVQFNNAGAFSGDSSLFWDNINKRLGVGTATPLSALHLLGNLNGVVTQRIENTNAGNAAGSALFLFSDTAAVSGIFRNSSANATYGGAGSLNLGTVDASPVAVVTANAVRMLVDSSGNVGVGTTAPSGQLEVKSAASTHNSVVMNTTTTGYASTLIFQEAGTTKAAIQYNPTVLAAGLLFNTNGGSSPANTRMVIDASGNVGIATTSPTAKLSVNGNISLEVATSNVDKGLYWKSDGDGAWGRIMRQASTGTMFLDSQVGTHLALQTSSGGNVGIGTANPSQKLEVAGNLKASYVEVGGTAWLHASGGVNVQMSDDAATAGSRRFQMSVGGGNWIMGPVTDDNAAWVATAIVANHNGQVGINTTANPSYALAVNGTAYASGAAGALSDIRHKANVKSLPSGALTLVSKLRPVSFEWKKPADDGMKGTQLGFIAQEVEEVLPEVVLTQSDKDKTKSIKPTELIPVLTKAVQELKADNDNLRAENAALRHDLEASNDNDLTQDAAIEDLRARIDALKAAR